MILPVTVKGQTVMISVKSTVNALTAHRTTVAAIQMLRLVEVLTVNVGKAESPVLSKVWPTVLLDHMARVVFLQSAVARNV